MKNQTQDAPAQTPARPARSIIGFSDIDGKHMVGVVSGGEVTPICSVSEFWEDPFERTDISAVNGASRAIGDISVRHFVPGHARIICVGLNYRDHVAEGPFSVPDHPEFFGRWTQSLGVSNQTVLIPPGEPGLDWEAELAVVIGRTVDFKSDHEAVRGAILGYAAFNDITARRAQHRVTQWTLGKNVDRSGVLGSLALASDVGDPSEGWSIEAKINGELLQSSTTDLLIFDIPRLISELAQTLTLQPGDVIATGTPRGVGHRRNPPMFLQNGDRVEISIQYLDPITTTIISREEGA